MKMVKVKMKSETLTLVLVNLAGIMERADEFLLPGVYKEVGAALHAGPTSLGSLTLYRSLVQSSCYPLAAYLSVYHNRAHVIAIGALLWAGATFLVGFSTTFLQVAISRGLNGIGLAIATPAIQSLVADSTDDSNRGVAFGWLLLTANLGAILGGLLSVLIASTSFMGIPGWRISFHLVAILSIIIGVLVRLFANDPNFLEGGNKPDNNSPGNSFLSQLRDLVYEAKSVMKIPSFQIIVAQGVSGSFPWSALSFSPMWLELVGFSHTQTALLLGTSVVGGSLGGVFGGKMGDILSLRFPNSGRIVMSQISSASALPLAALALLVLPYDPSTGLMHGFVLFIMGFFISWNSSATNKPIFAEIVPEKSRTSIYALDQSFELILASFAPTVVGILSQHLYSYKPAPPGSSETVGIRANKKNAASLAKALYTAIAFPMALCCFIYSFLYFTYPRDKLRAKMEALIESEMQNIEFANSPTSSNGIVRTETVIDLEYEDDSGLDTDESDDKALLSSELTIVNLEE